MLLRSARQLHGVFRRRARDRQSLRIKPWILSEIEASTIVYYTGWSRVSAQIIDDEQARMRERVYQLAAFERAAGRGVDDEGVHPARRHQAPRAVDQQAMEAKKTSRRHHERALERVWRPPRARAPMPRRSPAPAGAASSCSSRSEASRADLHRATPWAKAPFIPAISPSTARTRGGSIDARGDHPRRWAGSRLASQVPDRPKALAGSCRPLSSTAARVLRHADRSHRHRRGIWPTRSRSATVTALRNCRSTSDRIRRSGPAARFAMRWSGSRGAMRTS